MSKKDHIRAHYETKIDRPWPNYQIVDWASAASQRARFEVLVRHVDLAGRTLLDVGCGLGDLWGFLKERGVPADYTGVDILDIMAEAARRRHPDGRFSCADIFRHDPFGTRFDVVFCSGAFNLNLGNSDEFLPQALPRLFAFAREHLVFNLLHTRCMYRDRTYAHHDPAVVRRILAPLPCDVRVIDDYLPNDFTVLCRRRG